MELNPFVASAVEVGVIALLPFVVSYMALSEGLGLLMLHTGKRLFGSGGARSFLPFSAICGAAFIGPLNNFFLLLAPTLVSISIVFGAVGATLLAVLVYQGLSQARWTGG